MPYWTSVGSTSNQTITLQEHHHITTILRFPTSAPDGTTPFRGVRLTHPSFDDMGGDYAGIKGYLFATSAILAEEAITGTGLPAVTQQPSNATVYRTTVYDGFDLHSWANPSGALGTSLPVTAIARRTRIFTPGLPTRTILAGDPGNAAACDDRGPIQTDEWTGPEQTSIPAPSDLMSGTAGSSQVNTANSGIAGSVHRQGVIHRHFDWTLLRLLTDTDQKTLQGDALPLLRGVSSVDFGTTTFHYDELGRIKDETGDRGGYSANEHRDYNGNLPQISDTTKTLTGPNGSIYPNPDLPSVQAGVSRTFDTTYYQWTASETDKADGRASIVNTRDGLGRATKQTDVLGTVTDTTYNPWGQVETVTREAKGGANGSVGAVSTTTTYDPNGLWKDTAVQADGRTLTTHAEMDAFGRVTKVTGPDGSTQTFTYDGFGQKIAQSPVLKPGMTTTTAWGNETWAYDEQGRVTDHWDAQHRLLSHVVQQPKWDTINGVAGVWTTTRDDRTFTRSEAVDFLGQKLAVKDQKGQMSRYWYDQDGHLIKTQQGTQIRTYAYNPMGWLTDRTEPEEGPTNYDRFTLAGAPLVTTQVRSSGTRTFATSLDAHLQPWQITATGPEGTVTRVLSYDPATRLLTHLNETQAIAGLPQQALSEAYGYDALGRLFSKTVSDGDDGFTGNPATVTQAFTVSQTLNDGGQVTSLTYPSGGGKASQIVRTTYDTLDRPKAVALDGALRGMMLYGDANQQSVTDTLILGNGAETLSTSTRGELALSQHLVPAQSAAPSGVLESNPMTWTPGGLMLSRGNDTFQYDELQRLSHSVVHGVYGETVEQWFQYDAYGNRALNNFQYTAAGASAQPSEVLAWSGAYGPGNQLPSSLQAMSPGDPATSTVTGTLSTGVQYDDLGRMTQVWTTPGQASTLTTWVYDPSGRVMKENGTTYLLDASGLRFKRAKADGSVDYTVYGFGREPLAQFAIPAAAPTLQTKTASRTAFSAQAAPARSASPALIGGGGFAGAYILQPSAPLTVGMGQAVSFQGGTDFGTNLTWTFGDGATATGLSATHAFNAVGTYTVLFKAMANGYTGSTAKVVITVIAKPSITSFTASPGSITSGQTSTLAWAVTGATSLSLNQGIGAVSGTSYAVTPAVSTTYTLTATNAGGSVTATVTVAVSAPAAPTIQSFTASPATIAVGSSTTLAWNVTGGAAVSISGIASVSGTSVAVSPAQTTSYTLTATNAAGSATATITVTVETDLPVIGSLWADPYQISSGQSTTLNWAVSRADSVKLNGTTMTGASASASASVAPTTTTTYTLTATNLIGSVSATVTVSVGAPGSLVWRKTIVYGFGQELAEDQPGMGTTFIQSDYVGSPSVTTDANGIVIGRSKNLPFGERMASWGQKTIRRYTNHEDDPDSGAIYMQAREQLPAYGKFAQVDPAYDQTKDDPESWNLYNYVTNNPVTHTDPDGRIAELGSIALPSQHHFDFDTDTFDGDTNWAAMEAGGGSSGDTGSKSKQSQEATEPPPSTTETGTGDQGKTGTDGGTTSTKPPPPKEATTPKVETKPTQTGGAQPAAKSAVSLGTPAPGAKDNRVDVGSVTTVVTTKDNKQLDKGKFIDYVDDNAGDKSKGKCAAAIRKGMEAGGLDTTGRPKDAKDYGPFLMKTGATKIDLDNYSPSKGDIVVFDGNSSHPHGHIQTFDGSGWVSDFYQNHFSPYRTDVPPSAIYRFPDN